MSQAEELLNSVSEEIPVHTHPVPDTDTYFVIDPVTRKIENTNPKKHAIMQYDHNSERCTFELPRYIDGHDMLECTSVTVNVDNIEVVESEEVEPRINSDAPDMSDLRVHPTDPEKVICSWLISRNSTQLAGILSFHIEFKCVNPNGDVVYEWSTDTFSDITVKARKKNGEAAVVEHSDLLEQWRARIFGAGDSVMANIAAEGEAQVAAVKAESETQQGAVELKGAQTLDSIPEDYTEVDAMADEAVRSKGDAIVCEVAGESIAVKDSSNDHIRGLKLFGKSIQDGTPTTDNPVEITSIENLLVAVSGGNLISQIDMIAGDMSVPSERIYCGPNCKLTVRVTKARVNGVPITNNRIYPCVLSEKDKMGVEVSTYPDSVNLPSGSGTYEVTFITKPTTKSVRVNFTNNNSDPNLNTHITDVYVSIGDKIINDTYIDSQSISITRSISGIPVISGGNYTDSDGQQWICDEVDLERGVYVQRLKNVSFDGGEDWYQYGLYENGAVIYSIYSTEERPIKEKKQLSNLLNFNWTIGEKTPQNSFAIGATGGVYAVLSVDAFPSVDDWKALLAEYNMNVQYILATPIETPLTAEEITAFKALRTNYPNTTILNDAGAWMSVKYNADTKSYVDKPKTLRLIDTSTGVVYELKIVNGSLTVVPV